MDIGAEEADLALSAGIVEAGLCPAARHLARDAALLALHARGRIGDRLVLHRFLPSVVVGRHQTLGHEARLDHCRRNGIALERRPTAGGALYLDPGHQAASLILPRALLGANLAERLETGAALVAGALARFGIETAFKAPNDLELPSRQKIASVFLAEEGESALLFLSIIVTLDLPAAMQALLVPTEKLTRTGLEHARDRMGSLTETLGQAPDATELGAALAQAADDRLGTRLAGAPPLRPEAGESPALPLPEDWQGLGEGFETKDKVPGATLRLWLALDAKDHVTDLRLATDGHVGPARTLADLAAHLTGRPLATLAADAAAWLDRAAPDCAGFGPEDLLRLIGRAASKWRMQADLGLTPAQTSGLMLAGDGADPAAALARANVMLVPYCAKPAWCKWRHTVDCVECGACEVGDAYMMARERNMEVVTITNFEHLSQTLAGMKAQGVESYVGMCCGEFFLKRHHAFRDSGMEAVLLDIEGATCYELKEENLAYAGTFTAEAALDIDAVRKVMAQVPVQEPARRPCLTGDGPRVGERHHALVAGGGCKSCACRSRTAPTDPIPDAPPAGQGSGPFGR